MSNLRSTAFHARALLRDDTGAATAEYAIATMATVERIRRTRDNVDGKRRERRYA